MTRKYFGTDGIRGKANEFPMTAEMAQKVAMASVLALRERKQGGSNPQNRVVIGKDTRLSGYMLEQAMAAGFEAMGMDVIFLGPLPTPAVALLTRSMRADLGVMISASHNPYEDNGIKLFGPDGYKIPDETELAIEEWMDRDMADQMAMPGSLGKASRLDDAPGRYIEFVKSSFPRRKNLTGLKIVVDCANGAAYRVAPKILWELEAEVIKIGCTPDGRNINAGCGATDTALLQDKVIAEDADIGLALDGDADRLIVVDEKGNVVDGDQILSVLTLRMKEENTLAGDTVVSTVMSNLGMERFLAGQGVKLLRTPVGDRYVVEKMREGNYNLGGEQSGHVVLSDYSSTGDGLLTAMQVLAVLVDAGRPASEVLHVFEPVPQYLQNVRFSASEPPLGRAEIKEAMQRAEAALAGDGAGRLLVRASGTEPVIRVMAEGDDLARVKTVVNDLCALIEKTAG